MKINPKEIELRGRYILNAKNCFEGDDINNRIYDLITNYLIKIKSDESGWNQLFIDPEDNRYWELTYPNSEMHGGGPYLLYNISNDKAKEKYNIT